MNLDVATWDRWTHFLVAISSLGTFIAIVLVCHVAHFFLYRSAVFFRGQRNVPLEGGFKVAEFNPDTPRPAYYVPACYAFCIIVALACIAACASSLAHFILTLNAYTEGRIPSMPKPARGRLVDLILCPTIAFLSIRLIWQSRNDS